MKGSVIIVSDVPTHPARAGNASSICSYSRLLTDVGYKLHFCFLSWPSSARASIEFALKAHWENELTIYKPTRAENFIRGAQKVLCRKLKLPLPPNHSCPNRFVHKVASVQSSLNPRATIVNYWWLTATLGERSSGRKLVFTHDVFGNRRERTGDPWMSTSPGIEARALRRADVILAIQESEATYFRKVVNKRVLTTFSPCPISNFHEERPEDTLLFFSGPNRLNIDALSWFLREVWPSCRRANSNLRLLIGGAICGRLSGVQMQPGVSLCGAFDNAADFYKFGNLAINPCDTGSGLKIKTLEALANGLPLVCHPHSAEGLPSVEKAPIYTAESARAFSDLIARVNLESKGGGIRKAAYDYVKQINRTSQEAFIAAIESPI